MDTGDDPNAANLTLDPHRRNRGDDGADPNAAAGHPPGEPTRERPSRDELMSRPHRLLLLDGLFPLGWVPVEPSAARSQASSSAAPPSDHPGAERTGSGTRDRPRRSRRRRPTEHVEQHLGEVSSTELEVADLPTFEAQSASGSAGFHPDHPGAEGAVSGTRIRQSVLYSNRPRKPRRTQIPLLTKEHPCEVSSSELGGEATDLLTLEALSLSDPPPLTPRITGEETTSDDDDESSHLYGPKDSRYSISPVGLTRSMLLSLGDSFVTYVSMEEMCRPDSDEDSEELQREMKEYFDTHPPVSFEEALGTEPPRDPFLVDQEAPLLQAQQQDRAAAATHFQDSMAISHEASAGVIKDGKKWMRDEVTLCFRKHIEKTPYLAGLVFELDELCHQCFNVVSYMKVFHHYNFKIKMKMPASVEWIVRSYFGEVKEIFGRKFYFCCPLEPNESGHCYACKNQGVEDLKHPVTGGFETGLPDDFWYSDDNE